MKKTNFDKYLDEQLKDPEFAARFERAGEAWDVALQIAALSELSPLRQDKNGKKSPCSAFASPGSGHYHHL